MRTFATYTVVIFTTCKPGPPTSFVTCIHMLILDTQTRNQVQSIRRYGDQTRKYRSIFPSNIHCHVRLIWQTIFNGAWVLAKTALGHHPMYFLVTCAMYSWEMVSGLLFSRCPNFVSWLKESIGVGCICIWQRRTDACQGCMPSM